MVCEPEAAGSAHVSGSWKEAALSSPPALRSSLPQAEEKAAKQAKKDGKRSALRAQCALSPFSSPVFTPLTCVCLRSSRPRHARGRMAARTCHSSSRRRAETLAHGFHLLQSFVPCRCFVGFRLISLHVILIRLSPREEEAKLEAEKAKAEAEAAEKAAAEEREQAKKARLAQTAQHTHMHALLQAHQ